MSMNNKWDSHFLGCSSPEQLSNKYCIEIEAMTLLWFTKILKVKLDT